jgi:hypothetical protein
MTYVKNLVASVNGVTTYIPLYSGNTAGLTVSNKIFYGDTTNTMITGSFGIPIIINEVDYYYYLEGYNGSTNTNCCSNIVTNRPIDNTLGYRSGGFALININNNEQLFMEVFTTAPNDIRAFNAGVFI